MISEASDPSIRSAEDIPFVGREAELTRLVAGLEVARGGRGQVLLVAGEPGVGKTSLLHAATVQLAAGTGPTPVLLWGRCWEGDGAPPFWPWSHAFRRYVLHHDDLDLSDELGDDAAAITHIVPQLRHRFPHLPHQGGLDSEQARFRLFDRFTAFLQLASATQPLVLILDDLHWADVPSLRLLEFVAREIDSTPLAILATYRDTDVAPDHPFFHTLGALLREPVVRRFVLTGLSPSECMHYAARVAKTEISPQAGAALHSRTNGNPLFLKQVVDCLVVEDRLGMDADLWDRRLPVGLAEMIARRLAPLGDDTLAVLEVAAVIGNDFDLATLGAVHEAAPELCSTNRIDDLIDRAVSRGILQADEETAGQLRFTHTLIAEALRERIGSVRRMQLHAHIACSLASTGEGAEGRAATLAWHFSAAGAEYAERRLHYAHRAADEAVVRGAFEDAARFYQMALDATPATGVVAPPQRVALIEALAHARRTAGRLDEAQVLYDEVVQHALRADDFRQHARVALARAHVVPEYGKSSLRVCTWLDAATEHVGDRDRLLRSRLLARQAMETWSIDYSRARGLAQEALELAQEGDDPSAVAYAYYARFGGDLDIDRNEAGARMLAAGERAGDQELIAEARVQRLRGALERGEAGMVGREIVALQDLAARSHHPRHQWLAQMAQASWLITQGQVEIAEPIALRTLALGERAQEPNAQQILAAQLAQVRTQQGRLAEILPMLEAVACEHPAVPVWAAALAYAYTRLDRLDEARAVLATITDPHACLAYRDNAWLTMVYYLSCTVGEIGDPAWAKLVYEHLQPHSGRNVVDDVGCYGPADYALAKLALVLDDATAAARHFDSALRLSAALGARPALVESQYAYGAWLTQHTTHRERGIGLLQDAQATARQLGMEDLAGRAAAMLTAMSRAAAIPAPPAPPPPIASPCTFRREGDYWTLVYGGSLIRLRDAKALGYLVALLREPGRQWHVTDLLPRATPMAGSWQDEPLHASTLDTPAVADARASSEYRQRLTDARAELEEAESCNDLGRQEALRFEIDILLGELGGRLRVGSHARSTGGVETIRNTVTKSLRRQLTKIHQEHAVLGCHLLASVRIGLWCSYQPETPVEWETGGS